MGLSSTRAIWCWNRKCFDTISGDDTIFEQAPLRELAAKGQLMSYVHRGFWQCMDTEREKSMLEKMWASGCAPWEVWNQQ